MTYTNRYQNTNAFILGRIKASFYYLSYNYFFYIYVFSFSLDLSNITYYVVRTDTKVQTYSHLKELRHARTIFLIDFNFVYTIYVLHCTRKIILNNSNVRVTIGFGKFAS